jgi:hypothetical protein
MTEISFLPPQDAWEKLSGWHIQVGFVSDCWTLLLRAKFAAWYLLWVGFIDGAIVRRRGSVYFAHPGYRIDDFAVPLEGVNE